MRHAITFITAAVVAAMSLSPAIADPGRGNGHGNGQGNAQHGKGHSAKHKQGRGSEDGGRRHSRYVADCPPGLAKKNPPCVPPGQVGKRYGTRIGDTLRIGDYRIIRDRDRYDLDYRRGWDYYRDDDHIYRVDRDTRRILAIINLLDVLF